jgi:hypothetical protein
MLTFEYESPFRIGLCVLMSFPSTAKYHYRASPSLCNEDLLREGFEMVIRAISSDLAEVSDEVIVRILGVIHFVARRRSRAGREYLDVIRQYVGLRVGPGMGLLLDISGSKKE